MTYNVVFFVLLNMHSNFPCSFTIMMIHNDASHWHFSAYLHPQGKQKEKNSIWVWMMVFSKEKAFF